MRSRSAFAALAGAALLTVWGALPAEAHEEINPKAFPIGQPTFLTLTAANEKMTNLVRVAIKAAKGVPFGETTRSPAGWSATRTEGSVTWTGGTVKPDTFETFGFEIEGADQPGTLSYEVQLVYGDQRGEVENDGVTVEVSAVTPGASGTPAAPSATTITTVGTTSTTAPNAAGADADEDSDGASGTAKAALAVGIIALLVAVGALAVAGRRRSAGPGGGGPSGADRPSGAAQDW